MPRTDQTRERERLRYAQNTNADVVRKKKLEQYYANHEQRKAAARAWKAKNRDKCREHKKSWDTANKEHVQEYGKKRRAEKPAQLSESFRRWRLKNMERMRAHANRRRAAKVGSGGHFTAKEIRTLWVAQKGRCAYFSVCGNSLMPKGFRGTHRDHIEPLIPADPTRAPGTNTIGNIQLLCRVCNQRKKNHDPYQFTQQYEGRLFPDLPQVA